jgi:hypothetical protein
METTAVERETRIRPDSFEAKASDEKAAARRAPSGPALGEKRFTAPKRTRQYREARIDLSRFRWSGSISNRR